MAQLAKLTRNPKYNLREMLLAAGVGQFNAQLSLPQMLYPVRACDPYNQGSIQTVQALQNVMNQKGAKLALTGFLDRPTQHELRRYSGSSWQDKSWAQLLGDVMDNKPKPRPTVPMEAPAPAPGLGDVLGDVLYSPVGLAAAGFGAWLLFTKHKHRAR